MHRAYSSLTAASTARSAKSKPMSAVRNIWRTGATECCAFRHRLEACVTWNEDVLENVEDVLETIARHL
jgi:hypothetical protein